MNILFDSDVLIEYLRNNPFVVDRLESLAVSEAVLAITPITLAEIFSGIRSNERKKSEKTLGAFQCLPLGPEVGKRAGDYLKAYRKSHGLELPDALIAAAAAIHRFSLCSFNWKHYPMSEIERFRIDR